MSQEKKQTFYVEGMHCAACTFLIEEKIKGTHGIDRVQVNLAKATATVFGDFSEDSQMLAHELTRVVASDGYALSLEPVQKKHKYREFIVAFPVAFTFIAAFFLLQQFGFVHLVGSGKVGVATALFIGLIASVSTCLAVVGGLVLSLSAHAAKRNDRSRAQVLFHVGRLGGFFVLGGLVGVAGEVFQLGIWGTGLLGLGVSLVMFFLGVHLLDIFPRVRVFVPQLPPTVARILPKFHASTHVLAPALLGAGTFFLPCGFTQSMQLYALSTGNFLTGAYVMFFFALGTLPVLAALSFGAFEIARKPWNGVFFKAAGIVVVLLALFNGINALVTLGILSPLFSF